MCGLGARIAPLHKTKTCSKKKCTLTKILMTDLGSNRYNIANTALQTMKADRKSLVKLTVQPNGGAVLF